MVRSKLPDPWLGADLDGGWHEMENGCWRWTERVFSVRLKPKPSPAPTLRFRFSLPDEILTGTGPLRLDAVVSGVALPGYTCHSPGGHEYLQPVPLAALMDESVPIRFELNRALPPGPHDSRELGVQVVFWSYDGQTPQQLFPITIS